MFWLVISIVFGFLVTRNTKNIQLLFYGLTKRKIPLNQPALLLYIAIGFIILALVAAWLLYKEHTSYNVITRIILGLVIGILANRWFEYGKPTVLQSVVLLVLAFASFDVNHWRNILVELGFEQINTPWFSTSLSIDKIEIGGTEVSLYSPIVPDQQEIPPSVFGQISSVKHQIGRDFKYLSMFSKKSSLSERDLENSVKILTDLGNCINRLGHKRIETKIYVGESLKSVALNLHQSLQLNNGNPELSMAVENYRAASMYFNSLLLLNVDDCQNLTISKDEQIEKNIHFFLEYYKSSPYGAITLALFFEYINDVQMSLEILREWIENFKNQQHYSRGIEQAVYLVRVYSLYELIQGKYKPNESFDTLLEYSVEVEKLLTKYKEDHSVNIDCPSKEHQTIEHLPEFQRLVLVLLDIKKRFVIRFAKLNDKNDPLRSKRSHFQKKAKSLSQDLEYDLILCLNKIPKYFRLISSAEFAHTRAANIFKQAQFDYSEKRVKSQLMADVRRVRRILKNGSGYLEQARRDPSLPTWLIPVINAVDYKIKFAQKEIIDAIEN